MTNFDYTIFSAMNLQELAEIQSRIQKELDSKNKLIEGLKDTVSEALKKLAELSGENYILQIESQSPMLNDESNQEVPVLDTPEQEQKIEEPEHQQIENNIEEEPSVEEDCNPQEEPLPSFAALSDIDCDTILDSLVNNHPLEIKTPDDNEEGTLDDFEYSSEEEYNLVKKRSKMLPTLDTLLDGTLYPRISRLGFRAPESTPFRQYYRIIDSQGGGGSTLTTEFSPWLHIPEKPSSEPIEITAPEEYQEEKKRA